MDLSATARTLRGTAERAMFLRCKIQRDQAADEDSWGQKGEPDWQDHVTVPCHARTTAGAEPVDDRTTVVLVDRRILIPIGADVTEADRVEAITDRDGDTVLPGPMGIEAVLRHHTHIEIVVEQVA